MNINEAITATVLTADMSATQYNKIVAGLANVTIKEAHEATKIAGVFTTRDQAAATASKAELAEMRASNAYKSAVARDRRNSTTIEGRFGSLDNKRFGRA